METFIKYENGKIITDKTGHSYYRVHNMIDAKLISSLLSTIDGKPWTTLTKVDKWGGYIIVRDTTN